LEVLIIVKGASTVPKEAKQFRVYENIFYNINENGSNSSKIVRKQLNEYPFTSILLQYCRRDEEL